MWVGNLYCSDTLRVGGLTDEYVSPQSPRKRVGSPSEAGSILATGWVMACNAEFPSLPSGVAGSEKETWGRTVGCCKMVEPRCILEMLHCCRNYLLLEKNVGEGDEASHLIATVMKYQRNVSAA